MTSVATSRLLAIFDCDGTLVDSQADICAAMDAAFAAAGLTAPDRNATPRGRPFVARSHAPPAPRWHGR